MNEIGGVTPGVDGVDLDDGYYMTIAELFPRMPAVAGPLLRSADKTLAWIERGLYKAPAFIDTIRASVPEKVLRAVPSSGQKRRIAEGALKLMTKKDGSLMANLINPTTGRIESTVKLEEIKLTPEITSAMASYATQMQLAQIAEQIQLVQIAVEDVLKGQQNDRLAIAYSCQQKFLQAMEIKNPGLKETALLRIAGDAEDSRNLLMLSQISGLEFIKSQPEGTLGKVLQGAPVKKLNEVMGKIREGMCVTNMVSFVEALAYRELGESQAAGLSLRYYAEFIQKAYLDTPGLVDRLDLIDESPEHYWSRVLPGIKQRIQALTFNGEPDPLGFPEPKGFAHRFFQALRNRFR